MTLAIDEYPRYWAECFGTAPILPMSREEMDELGWDSCDVILVTGDAYVDHPSFGMALIGRLLEAQGFRVGIIAQPDWTSTADFMRLGRPNLYFGVTSGNMDSMVNRYTADRRLRHDDAYTPDNVGGKRPDRAVIVYSQRCQEAFKGVPVIIGGIEASLRRVAHYDYWSDKVRRSILLDAKADLLLFGNAERALVEVTHRLARGRALADMGDIRGLARLAVAAEDVRVVDLAEEGGAQPVRMPGQDPQTVVRLPSFEQVQADPRSYALASRVLHRETNPANARALVQAHGGQDLWLSPPPEPLTTRELDWVYDLPYSRRPHPSYGDARIPAWEMIRFSVNIMRGCFGGCTFCSITEHEGRVIQSRSEESILGEIARIRDLTPGFTGVISDVGGPTANMWRMNCTDERANASCRRPSCVYPSICRHLGTDHQPLIGLYRKAREVKGIKRVLVASGVRYDLANRSPEYIEELVRHHVGGYLKIAPEHTEPGPLALMMKPGTEAYETFSRLFDRASAAVGKEQYLIPYFIAGHPGSSEADMLRLALWLKRHRYRLDQVQAFYPTPMSTASAMYHSGFNPLVSLKRGEQVTTVKGLKERRLQKAYLRYHDEANWELLRESLTRLGRGDLIGLGPDHLVPPAPAREYRVPRRQNQAPSRRR